MRNLKRSSFKAEPMNNYRKVLGEAGVEELVS